MAPVPPYFVSIQLGGRYYVMSIWHACLIPTSHCTAYRLPAYMEALITNLSRRQLLIILMLCGVSNRRDRIIWEDYHTGETLPVRWPGNCTSKGQRSICWPYLIVILLQLTLILLQTEIGRASCRERV